MRLHGPAAGSVLTAPLDAFTAVYHRPSGITHLLTEPAPEILAAIGEGASIDEVAARLSADYDLDDPAALAARVDELIAAGLVRAG